MIRVGPGMELNDNELQMDFVRSSGPGGQNVNKVATAVQLRFNVDDSTSLPAPVKARLKRLAGNRMTGDGDLLIEARRYRSQERNRQDAVDRLVALIRQAATPPRPRKKTRRTRASKERRLEAKRQRGQKKKLRKPPRRGD